MRTTYVVRAFLDEEAGWWVAESDDVPGLATGAESLDALVAKLKSLVPELLYENKILADIDAPDLPISLMTMVNDGSHSGAH